MRTSLDFLSPLTASVVMILIAIVLSCFVVVPWVAGPAVSLSRRTIFVVLRTAFVLLLVLLLANPVHVVESDGHASAGRRASAARCVREHGAER